MEVPMLLFLDICRQCNRRQIQGFGVEYVVVFAKKNNNYVETEMGIVKKAFGQLLVVILLLTSLDGIFVELL
jgi:hypothetical protein